MFHSCISAKSFLCVFYFGLPSPSLSHWHKMADASSPARAEWTCVITAPSKLSVRKGHIFGYKKNDPWAVYSCSTAALFPFFGGKFFALTGQTLFFWVAFTHLRDSTRSSGEDARLGPAKESDTIFHQGTGNGMCFGFQLKKKSTVWEA